RKQRTNAQEKHGNPPRKPVWSTQILVSHDSIVRGAAWCRRPRTHATSAVSNGVANKFEWVRGNFRDNNPSPIVAGGNSELPSPAREEGTNNGDCACGFSPHAGEKIEQGLQLQSSSPSSPGWAVGKARRCSSESKGHCGAARRRGASEPVMPGSRLP